MMLIDAASHPPDASQRYGWFGGGTPTEGSEILLGAGIDTFEPIDDEQVLPLTWGFQLPMHVKLSARMRGLQPGNLDDDNAPGPQTLYKLLDERGAVMTATACAFPRQYPAIGGGWYQIGYGSSVVMRDRVSDMIDGQRVRIQAEIQDPAGHCARTERWVILQDAVPPSVDAGVPDARMSEPNARIPVQRTF